MHILFSATGALWVQNALVRVFSARNRPSHAVERRPLWDGGRAWRRETTQISPLKWG